MWIGGGPSGVINSLSRRFARLKRIVKRFSGNLSHTPFHYASMESSQEY
jgi:hypothetical protein